MSRNGSDLPVNIEMMEPRVMWSFAPAGPEFSISDLPGGFGGLGNKVATDGAGNFVAAWTGSDANENGIFARRFDAVGNPLGSEILVNTSTAGNQDVPAVAVDADGDFVVTWMGPYLYRKNTLYGVFARRFAPDGTPKGNEFRVSSAFSDELFPSVACDAAGNFVVAWQGVDPSTGKPANGWGAYAQRFDGAGAPVGSGFRLNSYLPGGQGKPSVAMDPGGNIVAAWESAGQDGNGLGIYGKRFTVSPGTGALTAGPEFRVNSYTASDQAAPFAGWRPDGGQLTIGWRSLGQDSDKEGVYAQRYDAAGDRVGGEFRVNTTTRGAQGGTAVAYDASGNSVIGWTDNLGPDSDVYAQAYDAVGDPDGGEMVLHSEVAGQQVGGYLAFQPDGTLVTLFRVPDPVGFGRIHARRFIRDAAPAATADATTPLDGTFSVAPVTDSQTQSITEEVLG
jgi:hypothetical protein